MMFNEIFISTQLMKIIMYDLKICVIPEVGNEDMYVSKFFNILTSS